MQNLSLVWKSSEPSLDFEMYDVKQTPHRTDAALGLVSCSGFRGNPIGRTSDRYIMFLSTWLPASLTVDC